MLTHAIECNAFQRGFTSLPISECAKLILGETEKVVTDRSTGAEVTLLLRSWADGNSESLNAVIPLVYGELRRIASREMNRGGRANHLQTTVLVHEAYEKLIAASHPDLRDRRHFFAVAARAIRQIVIDNYRAIRQIVIDNYRANMAAKRGAGQKVDLELKTGDLPSHDNPEKVLELSQAINRLLSENEELAEILELSSFAGLSNSEIAELHQTTVRTVQRKLLRAKTWVHHLMADDG